MQIESKFEYPISVLGRSDDNHLLVRLKTPPVVQGTRQPLVVGLAIDKSWSMKGEKMDAVLEAASSLVNWLTRLDYVAVVAYSNDIQIVQALTNLTEKVSISDKIRNIQVATSTNLSGGWLQTLRAIESKTIEGAFRRVILLTDGNPTLGVKDPEQLVQIAKDHALRGISTTTIGVGDDFNEHMLKSIAEAGGGNFYFIDNPEQASDIFFQEFGDIGALYAQALELKVQFPTELKFKSVLNNFAYDLSEDISELRGDVGGISKQTVTIQAGDIRSDDIKNIIGCFCYFFFELRIMPKRLLRSTLSRCSLPASPPGAGGASAGTSASGVSGGPISAPRPGSTSCPVRMPTAPDNACLFFSNAV